MIITSRDEVEDHLSYSYMSRYLVSEVENCIHLNLHHQQRNRDNRSIKDNRYISRDDVDIDR